MREGFHKFVHRKRGSMAIYDDGSARLEQSNRPQPFDAASTLDASPSDWRERCCRVAPGRIRTSKNLRRADRPGAVSRSLQFAGRPDRLKRSGRANNPERGQITSWAG